MYGIGFLLIGSCRWLQGRSVYVSKSLFRPEILTSRYSKEIMKLNRVKGITY